MQERPWKENYPGEGLDTPSEDSVPELLQVQEPSEPLQSLNSILDID